MQQSQIKSSYTGESDTRSWDIDVNLRIGESVKGSGVSKENSINLVKTEMGSSTSRGGFEADVAKNTGVGTIASTAAHEVGHNMGLPHVFAFNVNDAPLLTYPNTDLITGDNLLAKNLMMPGPFPTHLQGTTVLESQIQHIRSDYEQGNLNRTDVNGGDTKWGDLRTDTPAYYFQYFKTLNKQMLVPKQ